MSQDEALDDLELIQTECNVEQAGTYAEDSEGEAESFLLQSVSDEERRDLYDSVGYCKKWLDESSLYVLKPSLVRTAYKDRKELGLFMLFLTGTFFDNVRQWTSSALIRAGEREDHLTREELYAYVGLEIATSINQFNDLKDYWSKSAFLGNADFKRVLSRDRFLRIRGKLRLYPKYDHAVATSDPLWHSRVQLEHFMKNASSIAVPTGVSSLDENTIRCKARTTARSYMKNKPVRFGIRFYTVVSWENPYVHSFWDNGCGNKTGVSPPIAYCTMFRKLRGPYERTVDGKFVKKDSPSALWCLQIGHQTLTHPKPDKGRLVVMDNFYTRHVLGEQLKLLTDNEFRIVGTVRFNNIDGINRPAVKEAMVRVKASERGDWLLCHALTKSETRGADPIRAERCGYIVFNDRSTVVFYTNDLADTPRCAIEGPCDHTRRCVQGMARMRRWIGHESMHRTVLNVPAIVVAYNLFMNGVDRYDQFRSTNTIARRERRVPMSIFTFLLDAGIQNAFAVLNSITVPGEVTYNLREFKRRIAEFLVTPLLDKSQRRCSLRRIVTASVSREELPLDKIPLKSHYLLETEGKRSTPCKLCKLLNTGKKVSASIYSCVQCQSGFHVNCFTVYHERENLERERKPLHNLITQVEKGVEKGQRRDRRNKCTSSISNARLPF